MSDPRPCGGDAYSSEFPYQDRFADVPCELCRYYDLAFAGGEWGVCLSTDGYRWPALVASEVADERGDNIIELCKVDW